MEHFRKYYTMLFQIDGVEIMATAGTGENTQAAVDAERARIKAIDDMTLPGFEKMADKAKYEEPITAEAFAMQIIAEQKKTGQAVLTDREEDGCIAGFAWAYGNSGNCPRHESESLWVSDCRNG